MKAQYCKWAITPVRTGIMVVIFIAPNSLMKTTFIMIVCTLRGN